MELRYSVAASACIAFRRGGLVRPWISSRCPPQRRSWLDCGTACHFTPGHSAWWRGTPNRTAKLR